MSIQKLPRSLTQGGTHSIHDGGEGEVGVRHIFWGSKDLSIPCLFLGPEKICEFFFVIKKKIIFNVWLNKPILRYLYSSFVLFWVRNFDARYSFGSKISGSCIFLVCSIMKLHRTSPSFTVYCKYPLGFPYYWYNLNNMYTSWNLFSTMVIIKNVSFVSYFTNWLTVN